MLDWLYTAISWVLLRWHQVWGLIFNPNGGVAWALSIVFLVITVRILLFPLFVKQIHSMRAMQELQPKMAALKAKYKDDKQAQTRAMMELQKEAGANPLGGCLPLVAQIPVFIALYHVLRHLRPGSQALYGWTPAQMTSAVHAKLFGAPLPASFAHNTADLTALNANPTNTKIVIIILLLLSCAATFTTQKQNYNRNKNNLEGQQATIQKLMLYVLPFGLLVSGLLFAFPLGVLLYWVTNNVWTMGQQYYVFKRMPQKSPTATAGPAVDTKLLAPKVGQKPVNPKNTPGQKPRPERPTSSGTPAVAEAGGDGSRAPTRPGGGAPGGRPQGNKRPTATRPNRKKKRR